MRQPQEGEAEEKVDFRNQKHNVNTYSEIIDEAQRIKKAGPKKELEVNDQITIPYYSKYPLPQDFIVRFREAFIKDNLSVAYQATRPFVFLSVSEVDVLIDRYQRKHQLSEEDLTVGLPMANVYRTSSDHPEYNFQVILITYDDQKGVLYANRSALTHEQNHALEDELFPGLYFVFPQRKTGKRKYVGRSLSEDEEFYGIKKHWEKLKETRSFATYWQLTAPDEYFAELIRGMRGAIEPVGIEAGPIDRKEIFEKDPVGYLTASLFLETGLKFSFLKEMFQEAGLFIEAQSPLIAERREVLEKEWLVYAAKKMPEIVLEKMNQIAEQQSKTKTGNFREEEIVARMEYIEMAVYVKKQRALSPDILENVTKYLGDIRVGTSHITFEKIQRELEKAGWRI
ncbi:MAG: hypothetical protein Q7S00_04765 [bacterium]|nr:hypothetical protein [bacterium]